MDFLNHPDLGIRDLSYTRSRIGQLVDLTKGSVFDMGFGRVTTTSPQISSTKTTSGRATGWRSTSRSIPADLATSATSCITPNASR